MSHDHAGGRRGEGHPAPRPRASPIPKKTKVAGTGTTSYTAAKAQLGTGDLSVYLVDDVVQALKGGQIDAMITDLPGAFYVTSAQLENAAVIGQFADDKGGDQFAFILPKNSSLTPAVTKAVDTLQKNGTIAELQKKWLSARP